ncbi:uncharacterized protein V2V93DRAFT_374350 [Kockiozyma suomiensis]|uniref:uncharacterized protein n=1 Tax=Kockiozyma suomiensis TaxID=1337062 RepID=UPI003343CE50
MNADGGEDCFVLVVGSGPSALTLSYLLSGHEPVYNGVHSDPLVHSLLQKTPSLYDAILHNISLHRHILRTQTGVAAPVNTLLDSLAAPGIHFDPAGNKSLIRYRHRPAVPHLVVDSSFQPGGQWTAKDFPSQTLSYAQMLSLPGYSFADFMLETYGLPFDAYTRPPREDVAAYYALYPSKVGISGSIKGNSTVLSLRRRDASSFTAIIQNNDTGHLSIVAPRIVVLASGVFTHQLPPDPILIKAMSCQRVSKSTNEDGPVLVIGSGFSAADAVLSVPKHQKIIHIYKWDPLSRPSPLRACNRETYPEYASLYRHMRRSASVTTASSRSSCVTFDPAGLCGRYEGLPNSVVVDTPSVDTIRIQSSLGGIVERKVSQLQTYIGRIGVISYLSLSLRDEIGIGADQIWASKHSFRIRILERLDRWVTLRKHKKGWRLEEALYDLDTPIKDDDSCEVISDYSATHGLELADGVFAIGSLVGDSLVRYALGGCVTVAGNIFERYQTVISQRE